MGKVELAEVELAEVDLAEVAIKPGLCGCVKESAITSKFCNQYLFI